MAGAVPQVTPVSLQVTLATAYTPTSLALVAEPPNRRSLAEVTLPVTAPMGKRKKVRRLLPVTVELFCSSVGRVPKLVPALLPSRTWASASAASGKVPPPPEVTVTWAVPAWPQLAAVTVKGPPGVAPVVKPPVGPMVPPPDTVQAKIGACASGLPN